jgi:hypothetical protein
MKRVIVTRHPALVAVLRDEFPQLKDAEVLGHVNDPAQIAGAIVFGVVPLHLACAAHAVVEIPLNLAPADRGRELTVEEVRERMGAPRAYTVRALPLEEVL